MKLGFAKKFWFILKFWLILMKFVEKKMKFSLFLLKLLTKFNFTAACFQKVTFNQRFSSHTFNFFISF